VKNDVYQIITDRIIALLEAGTVPWKKPWKSTDNIPQNLLTRRPYRGVNAFLLNCAPYQSPYWLTWKQIQSMGGKVRKGERSFPVVFWKILVDEGDGERKRIPFLRYYHVWNCLQCEGIQTPSIPTRATQFTPIERCEAVVDQMPARPVICHGGNVASYSLVQDRVSMPERAAFDSPESYYSTLFHELTHATGHVTRLNRKELNAGSFGSDPYSREELVAEMGCAFLAGHCEIAHRTIDQSASYLSHWLSRLRDDRRLVTTAAALAQKAADFILHREPTDEEPGPAAEPQEYKVVALRDCPTPEQMMLCDTPERVVEYWRRHIQTHPLFDPECECLVALMLNTRRRVKGHYLISKGTMDMILTHPRDVYRTAVMAAASAIILVHNHPSGESQPSEADIRITRELTRCGQLLRIELLDHVIMGNPNHSSLRSSGLLFS
jgi:antirestriction protein ArdC